MDYVIGMGIIEVNLKNVKSYYFGELRLIVTFNDGSNAQFNKEKVDYIVPVENSVTPQFEEMNYNDN